MASATVSAVSSLLLGASAIPSSTPGPVRRDVIITLAAGDANFNFSGNTTTGLGTIYSATNPIALGSSTITFSLSNTASGGTIFPITSGETFVPSTTVGCTAVATVISSQ